MLLCQYCMPSQAAILCLLLWDEGRRPVGRPGISFQMSLTLLLSCSVLHLVFQIVQWACWRDLWYCCMTATVLVTLLMVHAKSCLLAKERRLKTYHQHKTHCYSMYGVPLIKGVIFGVSLCSCNLNYQVPVTGAGVQLITVGILCGRQYLMQLNVAQSWNGMDAEPVALQDGVNALRITFLALLSVPVMVNAGSKL